MGYPIYKLLRAVNRQYPNNGFINYVDVRDDTYDNEDPDQDKLIPEDLRDLINEALQETYIHIARDEMWSFPTVPGQNQYALPDDCDLRDIQEVTRTFSGFRGPMAPPPPMPGPGPDPQFDKIVKFEIDVSKGTMTSAQGTPIGSDIILYSVPSGDKVPEVPTVTANEDYTFLGWTDTQWTIAPEIVPTEEILNREVTEDITYRAVFDEGDDEMRSIITGYLSTDFSSTNEAEEKIPLDVKVNVGNLDLVSNDIVVGQGITLVKINATVQYEVGTLTSGSTRYFIINKNDEAIASIVKTDLAVNSGNTDYEVSFTPFLIDVAEGDHIYLSTQCADSDERKVIGTYNTYLTVEEVKVPVEQTNNQSGTAINGGYVPINPLG